MSQEIPKAYSAADVEKKWYTVWETSNVFAPEENSKKKPFTIVIPPPNVTGNLHMGHALDNSIQDLLIRYKRMQGFNALWLPGTDHAGIATQNVVAKALRKEGLTKEQLGREEFLKRVWQWKEEYGSNITRQLRRLGSALDWSRERFTMDEGLSKAVTREFVTLYKQGLIYRGKRLVNWCPKCGTAISDIEVEHESKKGKLWWIKYPVEGAKTHVIVATTRPETMLGDTAVAVNPKDKRYKKLIGKMLVLPLTGRKIPIIKDDFVDPEFGSGAVKVTPAHDPNDFEMGERHDLPRINILTKDAKITFAEFSDEEKKEIKELEGLDRYKARARVVELLEAQGVLDKIQDYENSVGQCYRCKQVIEPYLSDQWYVKIADLAREGIKAVESGKIKFVPDRWTKVYLQWMTNLRDWCISRQLWWGHRIPVYYCKSQPKTSKSKTNPKSQDQTCNEIIVAETKPEKCPKCAGTSLEQDPDVFDTWFSSALWPFSTLGWPEETKDLKTFYPTDVLVTGYDIITFWVSRMIMSGLHFMKKAPFHTVFIHGLVRDASGKKMSKSFGNVIDPIEIIDKIGADALRFALISLITGQGQDIKLTQDKITEARNFANKIWNVSRFVLMANDEIRMTNQSPISKLQNLELSDKWILSRYNQRIKEVAELLDGYDFGEAARVLYEFTWNEFCDWYIEMAKLRIYGQDEVGKQTVQAVLLHILAGTLKLLHPLMPFITEEINSRLQDRQTAGPQDFLLSKDWPKVDTKVIDPKVVAQMDTLMELIRAVRHIRKEMMLPEGKEANLIIVAAKTTDQETINNGLTYIKSLAKIGQIEVKAKLDKKPDQAATVVVAGMQIFMPLAGLVDLKKEAERLKAEEQKITREIERLNKLLSNKNFTSKAPPEAVNKQENTVKQLSEKQKLIAARLKDLG